MMLTDAVYGRFFVCLDEWMDELAGWLARLLVEWTL